MRNRRGLIDPAFKNWRLVSRPKFLTHKRESRHKNKDVPRAEQPIGPPQAPSICVVFTGRVRKASGVGSKSGKRDAKVSMQPLSFFRLGGRETSNSPLNPTGGLIYLNHRFASTDDKRIT